MTETGEVLKSLMEKEGKQINVSISFDEMNIKKFVYWNHWSKKFEGFVTVTEKPNGQYPLLATNVLAFMVSILDYEVCLPFAYYCVTTPTANEKRHMLKEVLSALEAVGVKVLSVCCDGNATNIPLFESMGASFNSDNMKPFITNPFNDTKICCLLDACHMTKLIRNALGELKQIFHPEHGKIKWEYIERLVNAKYKHNFISHKLTKRHLEFNLNNRNKMNVRLAVETFSNSTSMSMYYLQQNQVAGFKKSTPTYVFIKYMNILFDIFNSKKVVPNSFKGAITLENYAKVEEFFKKNCALY